MKGVMDMVKKKEADGEEKGARSWRLNDEIQPQHVVCLDTPVARRASVVN